MDLSPLSSIRFLVTDSSIISDFLFFLIASHEVVKYAFKVIVPDGLFGMIEKILSFSPTGL